MIVLIADGDFVSCMRQWRDILCGKLFFDDDVVLVIRGIIVGQQRHCVAIASKRKPNKNLHVGTHEKERAMWYVVWNRSLKGNGAEVKITVKNGEKVENYD